MIRCLPTVKRIRLILYLSTVCIKASLALDDSISSVKESISLLEQHVKIAFEGEHDDFFSFKQKAYQHLTSNLRDKKDSLFAEEIKKLLSPPLLVLPSTHDEGRRFLFTASPPKNHPALSPLTAVIAKLKSVNLGPEIADFLNPLISIYEAYRDRLCALIPEQRNTSLEKTICIEGITCRFMVSPEKARFALMTDEYGYHLQREHPGTHLVQRIGNVFFKNDGLTSLCPGLEVSAFLLQHYLFGDRAINPISLLKINHVSVKRSTDEQINRKLNLLPLEGKTVADYFHEDPSVIQTFVASGQSDYIGQVSLAVLGEDFDKRLKSDVSFLTSLNRQRYSSLYLGGLLMEPSDYKADNFICDENGYLVAIDSDNVFQPPLYEAGGKYYIGLKNVLYSLPILPNELIDSTIRGALSVLSPDLVILRWLYALYKYNQAYADFGMDNESYTWGFLEHSGKELCVPIQFSSSVVMNLRRRLGQLKSLVEQNEVLTHDQVFYEVYRNNNPLVYEAYHSLKNRFSDLQEIMCALYNDDLETILQRPLSSDEKAYIRENNHLDETSHPPLVLIQDLLNTFDLTSLSSARLLEIMTFIVNHLYDQGLYTTHSSWDNPLLLWQLFEEKASAQIFQFFYKRNPSLAEIEHPTYKKTLLHLLLETWEETPWHNELLNLISTNTTLEALDLYGISPLDIILDKKLLKPFRILMQKGAGAKLRPTLGIKFYGHLLKLKRQTPHDSELIETIKEFKILEARNSDLRFRMGIEHILGDSLGINIPLSSIEMIGTQTGAKTLPLNSFQQIFDEKMCVRRHNIEGRGTVAKASYQDDISQYTLYFKFFPELPGVEAAVSLLTHSFIGFGTSKSELFKVSNRIRVPIATSSGEKSPTKYKYADLENTPVLVSLGVEGRNLKHVFSQERERTDLLRNMDRVSLYNETLMAMLINPEDGKSDNYVVEELISTTRQRTYRLISVDNDHAFVPAVASVSGLFHKASIQSKTILYAFDHMKEPIPEETRTLFLNAPVNTILEHWLYRLHTLSSQYFNIFNDPNHTRLLFEKYQSFIGIPFAPHTIARLYTKYMKLKQELSSKADVTPLEIFIALEPTLNRRYIDRLYSPLTPLERFKLIEGQQAIVTMSRPADIFQSSGIPNDARIRELILKNEQFSPSQAHEELTKIIAQRQEFDQVQSGRLEAFRHLLCGDQIEDVLEQMDFAFPLSREIGEAYLQQLAQKIKTHLKIAKLTLKNHQSFNTADLKSWPETSLQDLTHIHLPGCQGIKEGGVNFLSRKCANLLSLDLSHNQTLRAFSYKPTGLVSNLATALPFTQLRYLNLSCSDELSHFNIDAPLLDSLNVSRAPKLVFLRGMTPQLRYLNIQGTPALESEDFADFVVTSPSLMHVEADSDKDLYTLGQRSEGKNYKKAVQLYSMAAKQNKPDALRALEVLNSKGIMVAALELGKIFHDGCVLVSENLTEEAEIYRQAMQRIGKELPIEQSIEFDSIENPTHAATIKLLNQYAEEQLVFYESLVTLTSKLLQEKLRTAYENLEENILDLQNIPLGNVELNLLLAVLRKSLNINTLYLSENRLELPEIASFSNSLGLDLFALKTVSLRSNTLGNQGAETISAALKRNKTVTYLDLQNNMIDSRGALFLSEMLQENNALLFLDVSNNRFGDYGTSLISSALKVNSTLQVLHMRFNNINDSGGQSLLSSLTINRNLSKLSLDHNRVNESTLTIIANQLMKRK
ncbi:MAG: hypothetical protein K2Y08_07980 [Alphaproteobacteria bacterium]|nr:hypothetical protein [Silvanigrellaceae bacterium]MBX9787259.1 hypothetical protein [Alphaproteobacteria bacterium]